MLRPEDYGFNPFSIPPLLAAAAAWCLGMTAVVRERGSRVSLALLLLTFCAAVWLSSYLGIYSSRSAEIAEQWIRVENAAVSFIPSLLLLFALTVTQQIRPFRYLLWAGFSLSGLFCLFALRSNGFIAGVIRYPWGYYARYGPFSVFFLIFFFCALAAALALYAVEARQAALPRHKRRLRGLLVAFSIASLGSVDYLAAYGIPVYPFGYLPVIVSILLLTRIVWLYRFLDITPQFAADQILKTMPGACFVVDEDRIIRIANPSGCRMLGYGDSELVGKPVSVVFLAAADGRSAQNLRTVLRAKDGRSIEVSLSTSKWPDQENEPGAEVYIALDLTDQKKTEQVTQALQRTNSRLKNLAQIDPLTELLNRRGLQRALTAEMARARREGCDLLALLLDLDNFKQVNDTLGHVAGDILLREAASRLRSSVRMTDHAGRIGGDEFLILLPQTRVAEGIRVAEKLRLAISTVTVPLSQPTAVTASIGLVRVSPETVTLDMLLEDAQPLLHESKKSGKNRVSFDEKRGTGAGMNTVSLNTCLHQLRHQENLRVVTQPILHLSDGNRLGVELLSRSGVESFEMPDDFFRLCLEGNALTVVDHLCFKNCLAAAAAFSADVRCHMNLFPSTLVNIPAPQLLELFPDSRPFKSYCIEISEQQIIGDPFYLLKPVRSLKQAGLSIAIDDVGFGRSCLESLVLLEPDILKIDKKCVSGIARSSQAIRSLKRLLKLSESLDTEVIAEGIETTEDLECLKGLGVQLGQGFLWGRPTPIPSG